METDPAPVEEAVPDVADEPVEAAAAPPSVVVVVVTRNPGPWFDEALASLAASDYPSLAVLVVDAGSDDDPTTRVAEVLPTGFVKRLPDPVGFAAAANEVLSTVEGAAFLLFCHDDAVLEPSAVRLLVEEAYRSNAAVVGPKVVEAADPEILCEVGLSIDRFGSTYTGIEPGELDQAQHDAVRDVFYVSSTALLVRADLFAELGGFDADAFPGSEDLDLCWRARLAGARIVVAPEARVGHHRAEGAKPASERGADPVMRRNRLRTLLKSYSASSLAWILPVAAVLAGAEALAYLLTGRFSRARAVVSAWGWNLLRPGSWRAARRGVQAHRTVGDRELAALQVRGSARLKAVLAERLHTEERVHSFTVRGRGVIEGAGTAARSAAGVGALVFLALVVIGSRSLILGSVPGVGSFLRWPSVGGLAETFVGAWRDASLGTSAPAAPGFGLMAAWSAVLVGSPALAQTLLVVGALPLGAFGVFRLARPFAPGVPALVAGLAYGINPVARNMIAHGRLGPLVFFALLPFLVSAVARPAGLLPGGQVRRRLTVPILKVAVLTAVAAGFWPPALAVVPAIGLVILGAAPVAGDTLRSVRLLVVAAAGAAVGALLLFPWPLALVGAGRERAFDLSAPVAITLADLLRFRTGPTGAGPAGILLLVAAGAALLVGRGPRFAWAVRSWALVAASFAAAWLPGRFSDSVPSPAPEGLLAVAAMGAALAVGLGAGAFEDELQRARFGWRQVVASAGVAALVVPALGFLGDVGGGRWRLPVRDWAASLSWMHEEGRSGEPSGGFRVVWMGDRRLVPGSVAVLPSGAAYSVTVDGPGGADDLWPGSVGAGDRALADVLELAASGATSRVGRLLAPMGVRYLALPTRAGPGAGERRPVPAGLEAALRNQLDLSILAGDPGMLLFRNEAWIATTSVVTGAAGRGLAASRGGPTAVLELDLDPAAARPLAATGGRAPAGTLLAGWSHDRSWTARVDGRRLPHLRLLGWANGYVVSRPGEVRLRFEGQTRRDLLLVVQALIVVAAVVLWRRTRGPGGGDGDPDPQPGGEGAVGGDDREPSAAAGDTPVGSGPEALALSAPAAPGGPEG